MNQFRKSDPRSELGFAVAAVPKTAALAAAVATLLIAACGVAAAAVNKCVVNGTVTYQSEPCPSDQVRKPPSIQELNAEERRRREAAAATASGKVRPGAPLPETGTHRTAPTSPSASGEGGSPAITPATAVPAAFRCDGRQHCSQMKSCAEAKYFLANCPNVKMDGDGDGIPCEQQWCNGRP
jgi:hypothetical protein